MTEAEAERKFRRVRACVQACEGIPTGLLEDGFITRLVVACVHVEDERVQDLLAQLAAPVESRNRKRSRAVGP